MTPVRPADVFGAPFLPPARATGVGNRLRAWVGGMYRRSAPPPVQIIESLLGSLDHAGLVALCRAGVPERLDRPRAITDLASELDVDPERLERLLRYAATRRWVQLDRRGRVRPTATTRFLRADHPGGWRAWVEFMGGTDVAGALAHLPEGLRAGADPFEAANGEPFFEWMTARPERGAAFDAAMAAGGRMHGLVLAAALDWPTGSRVCDVGGGTGDLLRTLLGHRPDLTGVLLDLPEVVARAVPADRLTIVGGDAFAEVPGGCDTYVLVNVVHDWPDDDAVRMLTQVATAMPAGGRVVIVEGERQRRPLDGIAARTDLLMLALTPGGRERTTAEVVTIAERSGLRHERAVPLASGDVAHVCRAAQDSGSRT